MIYLFAFTDHPELPLPSLHPPECSPHNQQELGCFAPHSELSGQAFDAKQSLQIMVHQGLAAIYSHIPTSRLRPDYFNIWQHESVVEALMSDRTVLPARFGSILENESRLQALMDQLYPDLLANLNRLAGRVEVSLHVLWNPPAPEDGDPPASNVEKESLASAAPQTGAEYMLDRLHQAQQQSAVRQKAKTLAAGIHASLKLLADESQVQVLPTHTLLLKAAYLVKRKQLDLFRKVVDHLSAENQSGAQGGADPGLNFICTGPWPPYSFINAQIPAQNPFLDASSFEL